MHTNEPQPIPHNQDDATRLVPGKTSTENTHPQDHYGFFTENLRIEGVIGEGGVGRVYLAYDKRIGRRVAVKEIINPPTEDTTELVNSFIHEAKITAKLEHPGIIPIYEIGNREQYGPYYVMKYIKGITMEEQLLAFDAQSAADDFKQRLKLLDPLIDVCEALAYAHERGVIHRDIKPTNIISGKFGETIIIDWGLAQAISANNNTYFFNNALNHQRNTLSDTRSSVAVGTPRYMAPEQCEGQACKASDVYSLGVILFRIITGKFPYQGALEDIEQQLNSPKKSPSPFQFNQSAPAELVAICEKAMAKPKQLRFRDAGELLKQLNDYRSGRMVNVYSYSKPELLRRFFSRNKLLVTMLCALLVAIMTGAGFAFHYAYLMEQEKTKAEHALVTITTFSERAQNEAHIIADAMQENAHLLYTDLKFVAAELAKLDPENSIQKNALLDNLRKLYPKVDAISIKQTDTLTPYTSSGWKASQQQYDIPVVLTSERRLQIVFRTPIYQSKQLEQFLEAVMYPETVMPALFSKIPKSGSELQDVWVLRHDGLIIYDKNLKYLGSNLFTDPINILSPSLLEFGQLSFSREEGIGHYTYHEDSHTIDKIAAWKTVQFSDTERWVVIVNYPYLTRSIVGESI
ncbi:MAG: protein kinase [Methyloprofundus sp.]|nr:protein kinase [Methyloprofundus sp.]